MYSALSTITPLRVYSTLVVIWFSLLGSAFVQAQSQQNLWKQLEKVEYIITGESFIDEIMLSEEVKAMEGKQVTIEGYMYPLNNGKQHDWFMLSGLPLNACFFCGVGGIESIMEIVAKDPIRYSKDKIKLKGKLHLCDLDEDGILYKLTDAESLP